MAEEARETAEEFGRRLAAETCAEFDRQRAEGEKMVTWLTNYGAAQLHVQATGGTMEDVMRMAFQAGNEPIEPPRPRLVVTRDR